MHQPIASLDLALSQNDPNKKEIRRKGLLFIKDVTDEDLILSSEWQECIKAPVSCTAFDLLVREHQRKKISTTIKDLDVALGGGLDAAKIYEFCSDTGVIKTNLCFNICVNYLLQIENKDKGILYVCTNDNFSVSRIKDFIKSSNEYKNQREDQVDVFIDNILDKIHVIDLCSIEEFLGIIKYLDKFLSERTIGLMIIDSIFMPFKQVNYEDQRGILYRSLRDLQKVAAEKQFPILVTNNFTTPSANSDNKKVYLGENYFHRINCRVSFSKLNHNIFTATILKSNCCDELRITFEFRNVDSV